MVSLQSYAGLGTKGLAAAIGKVGTVAVLKSISVAVAGGAGVVAIVALALLFSQLGRDWDSENVRGQHNKNKN